MKVRAITLNNGRYVINLDGSTRRNRSVLSDRAELYDLSGMPYYSPITFGLQNSTKLRELFGYGLPCMYSGIKMINPKELSKYVNNSAFNAPASDVMKIFQKHQDSIVGMEKKVVEIINDRAKIHPDKNIQEIIKDVESVYRRRLRKRQAPIFHEIGEMIKDLPQRYRTKFDKLMSETNSKLYDRPLVLPFSTNEFKYKFAKIREFLINTPNSKAKKTLNLISKEMKKFENSTNPETINNQIKVLDNIEQILNKSIIRNNEELRELINNSKSRLLHKSVVVPFSRKSFIYDLDKIIKPLGDAKFEEEILKIASKLPTSSQSLSAYMLKLSTETPDKIGYRILRPTTASIEHILPRSRGGKDVLSNYGGACANVNSARRSIPLNEWVILHPEIKENCQIYLNKLIELYHRGIFLKLGISPSYIYNFKNTVEKESKNMIKLDISKM